jgi:nitrite reductase (NADH) small subunit
MSWVDVARLDSIPPRGARVVELNDETIAVFRCSDDRLFAVVDRCPHRNGPLSQGIVHSHCVTCPLHDWIIDLSTGSAVGPDEGSVKTFSVRVVAGRVQIEHVAVQPLAAVG